VTRRDRAALVLALEWARTVPGRGGGPLIAVNEAQEILMSGRDACREIALSLARARSAFVVAMADSGACTIVGGDDARYWHVLRLNRRLLRARLALLIRALLRADAGDFGRVTGRVCERCGKFLPRQPPPNQHLYAGGHCSGLPFSTFSSRRIAPLWERARAAT
jgi:hypothetical protein